MTIDLATRHTVVSHLARGKRVQVVADLTTLPVAVVQQIGAEHGAPDMGKLANAADALRRQLDGDAVAEHKPGAEPRTAGGITAATGLGALLAEAERIGSARLASRTKDLVARLDQLRTDLAGAVKAYDQKAEKDAKRARLAELKAEEAKLRAELRGESKPSAKPKRARTAAAPKAPSEASVIRAWAKENGVECPEFGRIPQKVKDAYERGLLRAAIA